MPNMPPTQPTVRSLNDIIYSAVSLARLCLRMDVAFVTEFKDGLRIFRHIAGTEEFMPIKVGDSDPLEESYCQYVVNGEIPPMVDDSHIYPILKVLPATVAMEIRAHLGVPIRLSDGSVFGTFCCYSRKPNTVVRDIDVLAMTNFATLLAHMLEQRVVTDREMEKILARVGAAISNSVLQIAYQPIASLNTGEVVGYEALARFPASYELGIEQWFKEAHRVSLGVELELLAIRLAVKGIGRLGGNSYLTLNVSPETIVSGSLEQALAGAPFEKLVLEITEHVPIEQYQAVSVALQSLRKAGVRLAIDDAGSGYASFRHILQLSPDIIKLDGSLIRDIHVHHGQRALASALITFANEMGSKIVAEGVETESELSALRELGVEFAQGYLLGRPSIWDQMPAP